MTINDVLKLVDAGFTAAQISEMISAENLTNTATPEAAEVTPENREELPAENPTSATPQPQEVNIMEAIDKKFAELYSNLKNGAAAPSIGDIKPRGIEDIISSFFKED
mgnify:CR=1 FL=1